jgi:hypothetical protein
MHTRLPVSQTNSFVHVKKGKILFSAAPAPTAVIGPLHLSFRLAIPSVRANSGQTVLSARDSCVESIQLPLVPHSLDGVSSAFSPF